MRVDRQTQRDRKTHRFPPESVGRGDAAEKEEAGLGSWSRYQKQIGAWPWGIRGLTGV